MSVLGNNILAGASGQGGSYTIDRSLRFRSSASAYLSRTPASAGNRKTWTWSGWVKRGTIGSSYLVIYGAVISAGSTEESLVFWNDFLYYRDGVSGDYVKTSAVFRDPSAWYHVVFVYDSANATQADRGIFYINGVQQTLAITSIPLNRDSYINSANAQAIGRFGSIASNYFDGYLTEINFIDGQALDPTYFGEYNEDTGVWQAKKYGGTYGTNGFYLNFSDNSTTTTLGYDTSGNGNNWTANNISVTSGVTCDSMTDVPTLTSEDAANYATLNPLMLAGAGIDVALGNLYANRNSAGWARIAGSVGVTSGKWYWEITPTNNTTLQMIGIGLGNTPFNYPGYDSNTYGFYTGNGQKYNNATGTSYGSYSAGQIVGVALDLDNGKIWFSCNGTWQASGDPAAGTNAAFTSVSGTYFPEYGLNGISTNGHTNFGQRPFAYTPPAGFKSLNTYNLPDSTIEDGSEYFNTVLYTGNGTGQSITGVGFQPDWTWIKSRTSGGQGHRLVDAVRGAPLSLKSHSTDAEYNDTTALTAFASDGFTVGTLTDVNQSTYSYVAWNWKANGSGVSNTDGSITSTVSANTTAGFSIVTYTGNGTAGATVGHGLNDAPKMVIVKTRESSNTWRVGHDGLTSWAYQLRLDDTAGQALNNNIFNSTAPTSTVFTVGTSVTTNESTKGMVAYCFAEVPGFSKFGSYTGNGSTDGPFVFTGFRPAYVLVKNAAVANSWRLWDNKRPSYNVTNLYLSLDTSGAEGAINIDVDLLSNGFKIRNTNSSINGSGNSIIYMAFAENPFKNALAR